MAIAYEHVDLAIGPVVRVLLDGKMVGMILSEKDGGGFFYTPKKGARGEKFTTVEAVKQSLEMV